MTRVICLGSGINLRSIILICVVSLQCINELYYFEPAVQLQFVSAHHHRVSFVKGLVLRRDVL